MRVKAGAHVATLSIRGVRSITPPLSVGGVGGRADLLGVRARARARLRVRLRLRVMVMVGLTVRVRLGMGSG